MVFFAAGPPQGKSSPSGVSSMCSASVCEDYACHVARVLRTARAEPVQVTQVSSFDLTMAMVLAGLALGLAGTSQIAASREPGIVARQLAGGQPPLTTYLLHLDRLPSHTLGRFIERARR